MTINVSEEPATSVFCFDTGGSWVLLPWVPASKRYKVRFKQLNINIRLHEVVRSYMLTSEDILMFTCLLECGVLLIMFSCAEGCDR